MQKKEVINITYNTCTICGKKFPTWAFIDGKRAILKSRKHCLECVPYKSGVRIEDKDLDLGLDKGKEVKLCLYCGKPLDKKEKKYCNNDCQHKYAHEQYIARWKRGEEDGIIGNQFLDISKNIKTYIFEKYGYKCARCGWSEVNPYTGTIPLEIDHIDGNARNNKEENLILLCPNCHSLTPTYRGANRGNGHRNIKWTSR